MDVGDVVGTKDEKASIVMRLVYWPGYVWSSRGQGRFPILLWGICISRTKTELTDSDMTLYVERHHHNMA